MMEPPPPKTKSGGGGDNTKLMGSPAPKHKVRGGLHNRGEGGNNNKLMEPPPPIPMELMTPKRGGDSTIGKGGGVNNTKLMEPPPKTKSDGGG